jgi:riboflavin kinase/FMN adenylyltransferase
MKMEICDNLAELAPSRGFVHLAVGAFDGVHIGHQAVMREALLEADEESWGVVTFDPDPAHVLSPRHAPPVITPTPRKLEILRALGAQLAVVIPFTRQVARESAERFVEDRLAGHGRVRSIHVGTDFRFGHRARGDVNLLRALCGSHNVRVNTVGTVCVDGVDVSSSRIRSFVGAGDLDTARRLLGRPFSLWGIVGPGRGVGASIGFPTANLVPGDHLLPPRGVYTTATRLRGSWYGGAVNIGVRPTFFGPGRGGADGGGETIVEVHLLDFDGDIAGEAVEVLLGERIRDERRFESVEALRSRVRVDARFAQQWWEKDGQRLVSAAVLRPL